MKPQQLAAILQRAANLRRDVKKATIQAMGDGLHLVIDVLFYSGTRIRREAKVADVSLDATVGESLAQWLGPLPPMPPAALMREDQRLTQERRFYLDSTPEAVLQALQARRRETESKLDWKPEPDELPDTPPGILPSGVPNPVQADSQETPEQS